MMPHLHHLLYLAAGPDTTQFSNVAGNIEVLVAAFATIALVPLLVVAGFEYMLGGVEQKARVKHRGIQIAIGYGVIVLASAIAGVITALFK